MIEDELNNLLGIDNKSSNDQQASDPIKEELDRVLFGGSDNAVPSQKQPRGYIDSFISNAKSQGAGVYGGLANLVDANTGIGGDVADYFNKISADNAKTKQYSLKERIPFMSDYYVNPEGATADIGGALGSSAALLPASVAVAAALPEAAITAGAVSVGGLLARAGLGKLSQRFIVDGVATDAGRRFIAWGAAGSLGKIPEAASEGGNIVDELRSQGLSDDEIRNQANLLALKNIPPLMAEGALEYTGLTGSLGKVLGVGAVGDGFGKRLAKNVALNVPIQSASEGATELEQQILSNEATNKPHGSFFSPSTWTPDEEDAAGAGMVGGGFLGFVGAGNSARKKVTGSSNTGETSSDPIVDQLDAIINEQTLPTTSTSISTMQLPIADGVEDYVGVNENVKIGANNFGSYLQSLGLDPIITSGRRSAENNAAVGGAETSHHLSGNAVDIGLGDITPEQQAEIKARAEAAGWGEVLYHDAGTGLHLHLADFNGDPGQSYSPGAESSLLAESGDLKDIINEAATTYNLSPELIAAVMKQESSFNPNATSQSGAIGLMQLMPDTAAELGVDPNDARSNVMGGAKYLKQQLDAFGGDVQKALAAYNAGPGAVAEYNGIPPFAETQNYVKNIMGSLGSSKSSGAHSANVTSGTKSSVDVLNDLIQQQNLSDEQLKSVNVWAQNKSETENLSPDELNSINDSLDKGKNGLYEIASKYPIDIAKLFGIEEKSTQTADSNQDIVNDPLREATNIQVSNENEVGFKSAFASANNAVRDSYIDSMWNNIKNNTPIPRKGALENKLRDMQKENAITSRDDIAKIVENYYPQTAANTISPAASRVINNTTARDLSTSAINQIRQKQSNQQRIDAEQRLNTMNDLSEQQPASIETPTISNIPASLEAIENIKQSIRNNSGTANNILPTSEEIMMKRQIMRAVGDKRYETAANIADQMGLPEKAKLYRSMIPSNGGQVRETITADDLKRSANYNNLNDIEKLFIDMLKHYNTNISVIENELSAEYNRIIKAYEAVLQKQMKQSGITTVGENMSGDKFTRTQSGNFQWFKDLAKQYGYASANKLPKNILQKAIPQVALDHLRNGYTDPMYGQQVPEAEASKFNDLEGAINGIKQTRGKLESAIPDRLGQNERSSSNDSGIIQERTGQAIAIGKQLGYSEETRRAEPSRVGEHATPVHEIQRQVEKVENNPTEAIQDVNPSPSKKTESSSIIPKHTITEGVHTKTNKPIWIVRLVDKVDRSAYTAINTTMRKLGGYYSSFKGVNGFVFNENPAEKLGDTAEKPHDKQEEVVSQESTDTKNDDTSMLVEWLKAISTGDFTIKSFTNDNAYGSSALTELRRGKYVQSFNSKLSLSDKGKNRLAELTKTNEAKVEESPKVNEDVSEPQTELVKAVEVTNNPTTEQEAEKEPVQEPVKEAAQKEGKQFDASRQDVLKEKLMAKRKPTAKLVDVFDDSDENLQKALAKFNKATSKTNANPIFDPEVMESALEIGGIYIQRGINNFAEWSSQVVGLAGEKIRPYLPGVWDMVHAWPTNEKYDQETATLLFEYAGIQYEKGNATEESLTEAIRKELGEEFTSLAKVVYIGVAKYKETTATTSEDVTTSSNDSNYVAAVKNISDWVQQRIESGKKFSNQELFDQSDKAFNGRQGEGVYSPKDAYDAMELGVNKFLLKQDFANPEKAKTATEAINAIQKIRETIMNILPTQSKRTAEQEEFQQFSTPPHIAYVASWVSAINKNDTVVEPSAGIGGIATFAKATGANVIVNELSDRRGNILKTLPFDQVFGENAEQLDNILPGNIKPTVINMNPPFSSTAGRMEGKRATKNATLHIEQALNRLEPNGRLVAIVGQGMSEDAASFKSWWKKIKEQYNVRANIGIDGNDYTKYGTGFGIQLFVIDKTGKTEVPTITSNVSKVEDAISLLEGIKNDRDTGTNRLSEQTTSKSSSTELSEKSEGRPGPFGTVHVPADRVGNRNRGSGVKTSVNSDNPPGSHSKVVNDESTESNEISDPSRRSWADRSNAKQSESARDTSGSVGISDRPTSNGTGNSLIDTQHVENVNTDTVMSESTFDSYQPQRLSIAGAKPHPSPLVQSAAMAAVEPPIPTYKPNLPAETITKGKLSIAQLEPIVYAGQSFETTLPNKTRKGYFVGDGTGVGKGREISGILLDSIRNGQKKAVWISKNDALFDDAVRDWTDLGGNSSLLFPLKKTKLQDSIKQSGILFTTYPTLASNLDVTGNGEVKAKPNSKSRLSQIVDWLGKDFNGVIAFDEAHMMANSVPTKGKRGVKKASARGLAGVELQKLLPDAKIVYVSATGATEVENLAYASRLGLWGEGTPFSNVQDFIDQIKSSGLAGMELVARDMKAMGVYLARNLSFDGVTYGTVTHDLTADQRKIYDTMAKGWQVVLENINEALKATGAISNEGKVTNANAKKTAMGQFWGSQQRFFNQVLTSMQMPSVIEDVKKQIKDGNAIVMQLVNTNEATMNRQISNMEEDQSLDDLDMTPRDILMQYLDNSFPIQQYEEYTDDDGNLRSRSVVDSNGKPVLNREAIRMKESLMNKLGSMKVPEGPLELIINTFGTKAVGEVTGRQRRVVREKDSSGQTVSKIEKRSKAHNKADVKAFMDDKKSILIFSEAGGTGQSFHTDPKVKNQRRRIHYLIQPGWRADSAVQGFGRTHRSGEVSQPHYVLVTTNLKGQKRFISTIARRLDQLGALTKGQRDAANQGLFSAKDNLESEYAKDALQRFYENLIHNAYSDIDTHSMLVKMGLESFEKQEERQNSRGSVAEALRDVPKFLNRILALDSTEQNQVFDYFSDILDYNIEMHIANGTLDTGMETLRSEGVQVKEEKTVYIDPKSKAETKYVELEVKHKNDKVSYQVASSSRNFIGFYQNSKSGNVWAVRAGATRTNDNGTITDTIMLQSPSKNRYRSADKSELTKEGWKLLKDDQAKKAWDDAVKKEPQFRTEKMHMITGAILPIWNRLPQGQSRVIRVQSDDGKIFLGRVIRDRDINSTLRNLGATVNNNFTPSEIQDKILNKNNEVKLSNGWKAVRRKVSGEQRIELIGDDLWKFDTQIKNNGIIHERIQYKSRYFLPSGDNFTKSFEWLIKDRPIVDVIAPKTTHSTVSLNFGFDPTFGKFDDVELINEIKKLSTNIKAAMPGLIELGKRTFSDGYTKSGDWARKMRDHLGDSWSSFKPKILDVWKLVKDTDVNDRGKVQTENSSNDFDSRYKELHKKGYDRGQAIDIMVDEYRGANHDSDSHVPGFAQHEIFTSSRLDILQRDILSAITQKTSPAILEKQLFIEYNKTKGNDGNSKNWNDIIEDAAKKKGVLWYARKFISEAIQSGTETLGGEPGQRMEQSISRFLLESGNGRRDRISESKNSKINSQQTRNNQSVFNSPDSNKTRYDIKQFINDGHIKPVTLENIQKAFPTSSITQNNKTFDVKLPNGREITVNTEWDIKIKDIKGAEEAYKDIFPNGIPDNAMAAGRFDGVGTQGIIDLASFADQDIINHESFHAAFWMALSTNQQNAIYRKFGKDTAGEEKAALAYEEWRAKYDKPGIKEKGNILHRLFEKIRDFVANIRDTVFRDHKAVFKAIADGSVWKNKPAPNSMRSQSERTEKLSVRSEDKGIDDDTSKHSDNKQSASSLSAKSNSITLEQIQQKFPTLKFTEIPDGYQTIVPNGHAIEIKLNQDITPDYDAVLQAYGKEVADAVERGEMGAKGVTQAAVIMTKEGKISFGAVVELAKTANLGILDHETIHVVEALDLIPEKAWKALERKYDPNGTLSRAELEETVAEAYRAWNGQSSHMVFSRIKRFFKDLYDLIASPETIKLYKSISNGSIFQQRSNTEQSSASFSGELASSKYKYSLYDDIKKRLGYKASDNVTIMEKPKSGINPLRYFAQSANRLAEINPKIKPFVREALKAEEANETMRNDFSHRMDKAMALLKDKNDLNTWTDLMWLGDALKEEFTNSELLQDGHNNNVVKAYRMARIAIDKAYKLANDVHQGIETHTRNLNQTELQDFHNNPFITEVISEKPSGDDAHTLVTYRSPKISEIKDETVTAQQLEDLYNDENIQVLGEPRKIVGHILPGAKSIVHGDEMYSVNYRQQKAPINKLSGYVSHIFHEWTVYRKDEQPDGTFQYISEESADSVVNATKLANALADKLPNIEFVIKPKAFSMPGAVEAAAVVGDNEYFKIIKKLEDTFELSKVDANELANHSVKMKNRGRFLKSKLHRAGAEGYEKNIEKVLRTHFNQVSRYVALDPFKRRSISLFEKYYGRFDSEHSGEANFVKGYIKDMNGNPSEAEKVADKIVKSIPGLNKMLSTFSIDRPSIALSSFLTKWIGIAKLGAPNIASSLLNFSQLIGAGAKLEDFGALANGVKHMSNLSLTDRKVLKQAGVDANIGLASGAGYTDAKRFQGSVTNFIMYPFSLSEKTVRKITVLGAYYKGIEKGMSSTEAINYAKKINSEVNFNYGMSDTPRFIRAGGPITQLMFQFQKYPVKMLELMYDVSKNGGLKQNLRLWLPTLAIAGYWGIPGFGLIVIPVLGIALKHLFGFDGDDWEDVVKKATFDFAQGNAFLEAGVKAAWYGGGSLVAGIDISKRAGIGEFGSGGIYPKNGFEAAFKTMGAGGSTIYNAFTKAMEGDSVGTIKAISPGLGNVYAALQGQQVGKRDRVKNTYESVYDRIIKGLGFRPVDEAIDADIESIIKDVQRKRREDEKKAIDDYIANPTSRKAIDRIGELRITRQRIMNESKQKNLTNLQRTDKGISKKDRGNFYQLQQFGK